MAVPIKILVTFIVTFTFSVVNSPPIVRDLHSSKNASVKIAKADEKDVLNLPRKRRETARGHGCPKRKILYFGICRTYKELEDDFIASTTKTDPSYSTTAPVPDDKYIEPMATDVNLSVVALITSAMTTKRSNESRVRATQQTANVTEPNLSVQPLKTMEKPKLSDTGLKPISTKVTTKVTPNLELTDPRPVIKASNKKLINIVWTQPASAMVVKNVTTAMPSRVKQEPQTNPDLSVMSKATSTKTETKSAVSQSNGVMNVDLNNITEKVLSKKKSGRTTFITEPVLVEAKQKPTAVQTSFVTDPNQQDLTTRADEVTLSKTDVTSNTAAVDMNPTVTNVKDITTSVTVAETSYAETNSASVPHTTPLPTGTRFTEAESGSSTTTVESRKTSIPYFLYIFISALDAITWRCALILVGVGVIVLICIYVRKYKKLQKCDCEEEAFEKKIKQIVTSQ